VHLPDGNPAHDRAPSFPAGHVQQSVPEIWTGRADGVFDSSTGSAKLSLCVAITALLAVMF